jgi:hypothetical protein
VNEGETHCFAGVLEQWQSDSHGVWHFIPIPDPVAGALSATALMQRLESRRRSGFGSVKLTIRIGDSSWRTSAFPIGQTGWAVPVSARIRKAEAIAAGDAIPVELTF